MTSVVLQLTDLHLFADTNEMLHGIPTRDTFRDVLDFVDSQYGDCSEMLLTGDLAHDERLETYELLSDMLGDWVRRCHLIPGNHDDRNAIRRVFPELVTTEDGPLTFSFGANGWRLIGLDSHLPGEVGGHIDCDQLNWLERELAEHRDEPTILFMHHPPFAVGSPWLDAIAIQDPTGLVDLATSSPQVRIISTGHVHQEFHGRLRQIDVLTSPSTAIQFQPRTEEPTYESLPPGYRLFRLEEQNCQSNVIRLPDVRFAPATD